MRPVFLAGLLLAPTPALAQREDSQLWFQANGSVPVAEDTQVIVEAIGRFSDNAGGFAHNEIGGLLTHDAGDRFELAIGYRHVEDYEQGRTKPNEERLRQQVTMTVGHGFGIRFRLEERFHQRGREMGVRLRPQLRYTLPLGRAKDAPFVLATAESFVNFNATDWGQERGVERVRHTILVSLPLSSNLRGDVGYLNQYRFGRGAERDLMEHAATFALTLAL